MTDNFKTIAGEGFFELVEKKSRFLGYAMPISTPADADAFIARIKAEHPDARHHVFAYAVGGLDGSAEVRRMSDDGEPQGTGGVPCLDVISKKGLRCTAVVVVRYFGGILLGAPGLVRAYGKAAAGAVDAAGECLMIRCRRVTVTADYQLYGKMLHIGENSGYKMDPPVFGENVSFDLTVPEDEAEKFAAYIRDISNTRAVAEVSEETVFCSESDVIL